MKQLNGEPVMETLLVHSYELTLAETESILAAPDGEQESRIRDLLENRAPLPGTYYGGAIPHLRDSYGRKLAEKRLREIKQLAAPAETETFFIGPDGIKTLRRDGYVPF